MNQPQPDVAIAENSSELNAFLESLLRKWYTFGVLLKRNYSFYVIKREVDNKCWLVSEDWWFNGETFWANEYWFDGIDTQEIGDKVIVEFRENWDSKALRLDKDWFSQAWEDEINIGDIINSFLAWVDWTLN